MGATRSGRRVAYDRVWGALLLLTCVIPAQMTTGEAWFERLYVPGSVTQSSWIVLGTASGLVAVLLGFLGSRGRWRHGINILLGCTLLAMPLLWPGIWKSFPVANPAQLPLTSLGKAGWVMLLAIGAVYIGAGIRVARPTNFAGTALATPGALVLAIFACLPREVGGAGYASERVLEFREFGTHWRSLVPTVLVAGAVVASVLNMVRNEREVLLARISRLLLVAALLCVILIPFLAPTEDVLVWRGPVAWGAVRFFGPLFLAIDGAIAFLAISITRTQE